MTREATRWLSSSFRYYLSHANHLIMANSATQELSQVLACFTLNQAATAVKEFIQHQVAQLAILVEAAPVASTALIG